MYTAFASVYDRLMYDVDYLRWANFYHKLIEDAGITHGKLCECACGTGSLSIPLYKLGYQVTGVDISSDMLFEASQKARKAGAMIPFVRQDMRKLKLHRPMDCVLCTNDGLNYIETEEELTEFFTSAYAILKPGGVIAMDLSTPYKLKHVLGDYFIGDETSEIAYLWQNRYNNEGHYVDLDLAVFVKKQKDGDEYIRIGEQQRQYSHGRDTLTRALANSGFETIQFFADKILTAPAENETRWFIRAKKHLHITDI